MPRPLPTAMLALALGMGLAAQVRPDPPETDRYRPRDPSSLTVPRRPVTRKDYVDLVRPLAEGFESGPDRGQYGPRHALPALAVFALEGNRPLAEGIKKTLRHYARWVEETVRRDGGVFSMEGPALVGFHVRELRRAGLITPEDETWIRRLLLTLRQYQFAWRPKDGLWRGSHHRSQAQGIAHALAAAWYPDEPDAPKWKAYAEQVWRDWWDFRDVGINDTGYFFSSFGNILRCAELLGRTEVFTDPQARQIFERILFELTPDGAGVPYGASGGYHSAAGTRILALELAARYTRDGRYRWGAHRLMNFGQARGFSPGHHHLQAVSLEDIALASLVCDDTVAPVEPEPASKLLLRKEIVRLTDAQAKAMFPEAGGVDCNMFMTHTVMPHKLVFRAGWNPGDLYMLVECYPRHDPLNPTAIVGLERYSAAMAEMTSEKFVSRENAVHIADLSGSATFLGQKNFRGEKKLPVGWAGMQSRVPSFSDHPLAAHARIEVTGYMGYEARQEREILFVKNRFVLVRDQTEFADSFRARVGPVWNTQNVGTPRGTHWVNTWFTGHYFQKIKLYDTPSWDLLIWHAPHADRKLAVAPADENPLSGVPMLATSYTWEGTVQPGQRLQFVQVLLPHAPLRDVTSLAEGIQALIDRPGLAAVSVQTGSRRELALVNPEGIGVELPAAGSTISTDARAAYWDFEGTAIRRGLAIEATWVRIGTRQVHSSPTRSNCQF